MAVWPYIPQRGITETLEWLTDVIRCRTEEYRACLRAEPRQEFTFRYQMTPTQFGKAKELAKETGGSNIYLPVWTEMTEVGRIAAHQVSLPVDGSHACYSDGGKLFVWDDDEHCEIVTISTVGEGVINLNPWVVVAYDNACVMPLRVATFAQEFEADRDEVGTIIKTTARFSVVATEDLSAESGLTYQDFGGHPLVTDRPELAAGSVSEQFTREVDTLDSWSGVVWKWNIWGHPIQTSKLAWYLATKEALWDFRIWLHHIKGRWKGLWVSSWSADLTVVQTVAEGAYQVIIADIDYWNHYPPNATFVIRKTDGTCVPVTVTACAAGDPGEQVLTITESVSPAIPVASIDKMSRLVFSRFDSDRIEIQHRVGAAATVAIPTVELPL